MSIKDRAVAGLSLVELAKLGLISATEKVINATDEVLTIAPDLGKRPPAGLSTLAMAQLGSEKATEKVIQSL